MNANQKVKELESNIEAERVKHSQALAHELTKVWSLHSNFLYKRNIKYPHLKDFWILNWKTYNIESFKTR